MANNDNLNTEDVLEDLDPSFYDYMLETKESSFDAEAIVVSYGRNKLKCIKVDTRYFSLKVWNVIIYISW